MSFSLTHSPTRSSTRSPRSPLLAARVLLQRSSLRRALAAGADPESSAQLARRAEQLTSLRRRRALAAALNRALREAEAPPAPFTAAVPVRRREIRKTRDEIEQLARDLLAPGEVRPRGVVLVQNMLTHGESPLFTASPDGALQRAVRQARSALHVE